MPPWAFRLEVRHTGVNLVCSALKLAREKHRCIRLKCFHSVKYCRELLILNLDLMNSLSCDINCISRNYSNRISRIINGIFHKILMRWPSESPSLRHILISYYGVYAFHCLSFALIYAKDLGMSIGTSKYLCMNHSRYREVIKEGSSTCDNVSCVSTHTIFTHVSVRLRTAFHNSRSKVEITTVHMSSHF